MSLQKARSIEGFPSELVINKDRDAEEKEYSFMEKLRIVFTQITVEPIMICYTLPSVMSSLATQNLNLEKACRVSYEYNSTVCDALAARDSSGFTEDQEITVQKLVASAMAVKNTIQSVFPALILMFMGSWSDRTGRRKPCVILPIIGELISVSGFLLCTYYFYELSLFYNVFFEAVPPALTGGWFTMYMAVYSYVSGLSSLETRTLRIGAVNMLSNTSVTIGIALSGILYTMLGFYGVFSIAAGLYITGITYGMLRLKEAPAADECTQDVPGSSEKESAVKEIEPKVKKNLIADFFDMEHIRHTMRIVFKKGEGKRKVKICSIMILVMVIIGPMHGEMNVMYLFLRYKYKWNEIDYSIYSTFNVVAQIIGTLFCLFFFTKFLKLDDTLLGVISCMSKVLASFVYAFAPTSTIFYLGAIVEMLTNTSFIAMRSIISKLVPADELGKVYSLFGVCEALMPLVYGPLYSIIYRSTINHLPGAFFLAGGILTIPAVLIFFWLYTEHRKELKEEKDAELNKAQSEKLLTTTN